MSNAAKGRSFKVICEIALRIARQWRWSAAKAKQLLVDMELYYHSKAPFIGGHTQARVWWGELSVSAEEHPIKSLGIIFASIVPHSADVERLFSDLGGVQGVRRCNLTVDTFQTLGKLRAHYTHQIHLRARENGKPIRRRHAHMHTHEDGGINLGLATDLQTSFSIDPTTSEVGWVQENDILHGPEDITEEELDEAFAELDRQNSESTSLPIDPELASEEAEIVVGQVYDLKEMEHIEKGLAPTNFENDVCAVGDSDAADWDVETMMQVGSVCF